jgi:hypothetical protein
MMKKQTDSKGFELSHYTSVLFIVKFYSLNKSVTNWLLGVWLYTVRVCGCFGFHKIA